MTPARLRLLDVCVTLRSGGRNSRKVPNVQETWQEVPGDWTELSVDAQHTPRGKHILVGPTEMSGKGHATSRQTGRIAAQAQTIRPGDGPSHTRFQQTAMMCLGSIIPVSLMRDVGHRDRSQLGPNCTAIPTHKARNLVRH